MPALDIPAVIDLLERANDRGLQLSCHHNELNVNYVQGQQIEPNFLAELRNNKHSIIEYLNLFQKNESTNIEDIYNYVSRVEQGGEYYYDITPTQDYWVNENKDSEYKEKENVHSMILSIYKATGNFDPGIFKEAIAHVVQHHESLRSTFHKVAGKYRLRVENANTRRYQTTFKDMRHLPIGRLTELEAHIKFDDHKFSLTEGPLFLSRVTQTGDQEYIISIKVHHVISDTWSNEVLIGDLITAYQSIRKGLPPVLQELKFQFKEFLSFINYYKQKHHQAHKQYWKNEHPQLPGELIIPGMKKREGRKLEDRIRKSIDYTLPVELTNQLNVLTKQYTTTLFVVLQATFKAFLFIKTGHADIIIGTNVAGRDYPETQHQVGSYARTDLIRTAFSPNDTLAELVKKVKKANEDMSTFRAFTLNSAIDELMQPGQQYDTFWKVNMLYADTNGFYINKSGFSELAAGLAINFMPLTKNANIYIPIDMILQFYHCKDTLALQVEYDSSTYDETTMQTLFNDYLQFIPKAIGQLYTPLKEII